MKEEQKQAVAKILGYTPYEHQLQALYEAFNPVPTEQEVCEALSEYLANELVRYDNERKTFKTPHNDITTYNRRYSTYSFNFWLPPHLITLIGRFYEGLEAQDE